MQAEYWYGGHTKHKIMFHLVWIPKYRKRLLKGHVKLRLEELFEECCLINNWRIHELNIQEDHVHMLIQVKATDSISSVIQKIKGGSSKKIRLEFPGLKEFLWGDSFWADGYFAESVGKVNESTIRKYIQNQDKIN